MLTAAAGLAACNGIDDHSRGAGNLVPKRRIDEDPGDPGPRPRDYFVVMRDQRGSGLSRSHDCGVYSDLGRMDA